MRSEFASLRAADANGVPALLDTYGATDPAEFFAVSVEAFFEKPHALRAHHPKLYAELRNYFQQDPVEFSAESVGNAPRCGVRTAQRASLPLHYCGCGTIRRYGFGAFQPCG